jgi:ribonucleoside-diphosphate reductase alpha chain
MFVENGKFDHDTFIRLNELQNLNKVIDRNYYPEAENSNMRHRPVGLGVQGLADALSCCVYRLHLTRLKNQEIFETLYFAVTASMEMAKKKDLILVEGSNVKRRIPVQYVGNER